MGFFDVMSRMLQGKPAFESQIPPAVQPQQQASSPSDTHPAFNKSDPHTLPVVVVERIKNHENGQKVQIYGYIKNTWQDEVMLDKIRWLGITRELDVYLRAGEVREFLLYDGPKLQREYHEALLDYKTKREADYFEAVFEVRFDYRDSDKTYWVDNLHLHHPIRDIYG